MQINIFEVFNDKGKRLFFTYEKSCIPPKEQLKAIIKDGYKIKVNGATITKKKLDELLKEI